MDGKNNFSDIIITLIQVLESAKALDATPIRLPEPAFTSELLIVTALNERHAKALFETVLRYCFANNIKVLRSEGTTSSNWILMDFGDCVLNIFTKEKRDLFALEELWKNTVTMENN